MISFKRTIDIDKYGRTGYDATIHYEFDESELDIHEMLYHMKSFISALGFSDTVINNGFVNIAEFDSTLIDGIHYKE